MDAFIDRLAKIVADAACEHGPDAGKWAMSAVAAQYGVATAKAVTWRIIVVNNEREIVNSLASQFAALDCDAVQETIASIGYFPIALRIALSRYTLDDNLAAMRAAVER